MSEEDEDLMVTLFFVAFVIFIGFFTFLGVVITVWSLL